ncbi:MAG: AMP-binding protein, partial [Clostridia bacterium]|nr:AMP-binding protein [Clostridia bacterium]
KIRQGYGLTECSPILCVNQEIKNDYASVGPAMPGVTIKLGDPDEEGRGEILAKGDNIMLGYYENEEATKAVFTEDGWFKTGDQAYMDKNGCFHITGRIKNLIVTKTGKNIFPEELEALINKVPFVKESVVWGDDGGMEADTDICVTIVPNPDGFKEAGIEEPTTEVMEKMLWEEVKKINKDLVTYKRIKRMELRMEEFEKTTTHKIKRYKLEHK